MADIGSVLGGRYRLIELLGQGGMATIYRARDNELERDVAVKLLRPEYGRDPDFLARFRSEAQAAASLNDPRIVSVFDYGQDAAGPFIVMELIDGEDLASVVRRVGALPPRQAARLAGEVGRALEVAHRRGIVHRDVKPGNVMVARDGRVKVADFGIARALSEAQMTLPGTTLGSVHYFSPEQARGEPTTPASDVYSLGIVLYELLTGRRPWTGDSAAAIAMARLTGPPPSPGAVRAGIPPALEAITLRAMALDPVARYQSGGVMAEAIEELLADWAAAGAAAGSGAGPGAATPPGAAATPPGGTAATSLAAGGLGAAGAAGAAGGFGGGPTGPNTVVSGVARPNPGRVPYAPDAYATEDEAWDRAPRGRAARPYDDDRYDDEERGGTSPWVWISALLALAILGVIGFLVFRLLAGSTPTAQQVTVPNFVGMQLEEAQAAAERVGLEIRVERTEPNTSPDVEPNEILSQEPAAGGTIDEGGTVEVVTAVGPDSVTVPNLINLPEQQALRLIVDAGLDIGTRSEDHDPVVVAGNISVQSHAAGLLVAPETPIDYTVSLGPEPSPSPSPSPTPSPTPTPTPTPAPTPTPTPAPTPTPTPAPRNVGDYRCVTLAQARAQIETDGFTVGTVTGQPDGYTWTDENEPLVVAQAPNPGQNRPVGTPIELTVYDPASFPFETCPPPP